MQHNYFCNDTRCNSIVRRTAGFLVMALAVLALSAGEARAQYSADTRVGIGVAATGSMPLGDFRDAAGFGIGGLGSIELGTYPGLAVTARSGYIRFMEEDDLETSMIPIMGGAKFTVPATPLYLAGELGAVITKIEDNGSGIVDRSDDATNLGWSAGVGAAVGPLDLRLSYSVWDAGHMNESSTIGLSLGLIIWSL